MRKKKFASKKGITIIKNCDVIQQKNYRRRKKYYAKRKKAICTKGEIK
jgi:hypothetical protein